MQKIKIGICDDEQIILNQLKLRVEEFTSKNEWISEIITFQSGRKLLQHISEIDLVFLDIKMPELDGIETGKYIQTINRNCKIIISTSKVGCFKEAFKINAFRFITKPFVIAEIEEALQAFCNLQIGREAIELYEQRIRYSIYQRDIIYIIAYDRYCFAKYIYV